MTDSDHVSEHRDVVITGPDGGEAIDLAGIRMRILEDGRTTDHRLGVGEITLPPTRKALPSTVTLVTTKGSTSSPAPLASPWATRRTRHLRALW